MNATAQTPQTRKATDPAGGLTSTVQLLSLPAGVYLYSVKAGQPHRAKATGGITLPSIHVGPGPGVAPESIEVMSKNGDFGGWLSAPGDFLVMRLSAPSTALLITSLRDAGGEELVISAERLDTRLESAPTSDTPKTREKAPGLALDITTHIRNVGDMHFERTAWAGRRGTGLWLESFSVKPLETLTAADIEYKGLTASGFETPWMSQDKLCGTTGMGVALIGFAIRLRPNAKTAAFECQYSGYFQSGALVGPLRNGAPCRSTIANDPLEGIQVRIVPRATAVTAASTAVTPIGASTRPKSSPKGAKRRLKTRRPKPVATKARSSGGKAKSGVEKKSARTARPAASKPKKSSRSKAAAKRAAKTVTTARARPVPRRGSGASKAAPVVTPSSARR